MSGSLGEREMLWEHQLENMGTQGKYEPKPLISIEMGEGFCKKRSILLLVYIIVI